MHINARDQSPSLNFCFISGTPELSLLVYHYKIWSFVAIQKTKMNGPEVNLSLGYSF